MYNLRISSIVAGAAFVLSFLIGLLSGSSFPTLIIRPGIFAVFFFIFSELAGFLVNRFLPELLDKEAGTPEIDMPGSRIDIIEDAPSVSSVVFARPDESNGELGDISQILNPVAMDSSPLSDGLGMDQTEETVYNELEVSGSLSQDGDSVDALPDLESLVGAFLPSAKEQEEEIEEFSSSEPVKRPSSGNKAQKMDVDFHPKELAAGIRTVLTKDDV